ncbi:hypothetical protein CTA1_1179 [Colletotrichum tanaceti]|uniref:Uncharacterized protein n=1 Tax=Colletotrichum tanaceti TaxID=1306861 RepID=A0A4V6DFT9_9PEZI|nr:hypothetical protein CTA1_1179 [Colletotrichum tanaceti]
MVQRHAQLLCGLWPLGLEKMSTSGRYLTEYTDTFGKLEIINLPQRASLEPRRTDLLAIETAVGQGGGTIAPVMVTALTLTISAPSRNRGAASLDAVRDDMTTSWPLVSGPVHPLLVIWIVSDLAKVGGWVGGVAASPNNSEMGSIGCLTRSEPPVLGT